MSGSVFGVYLYPLRWKPSVWIVFACANGWSAYLVWIYRLLWFQFLDGRRGLTAQEQSWLMTPVLLSLALTVLATPVLWIVQKLSTMNKLGRLADAAFGVFAGVVFLGCVFVIIAFAHTGG